MFKAALQLWQYRLLLAFKRSSIKGFTLLELLIAVTISSIVVSGLLYLVVELLRIDSRETALEEVQRDTQRAMNYMVDELREAVYVYSTPGTITTPNTIANSVTGVGAALPSGSVPILAFWKASPISAGNMPSGACSTTFSGSAAKISACEALKIRRASYDLVVYSQISGPARPWKGKSRIVRYVLKQYEDARTLQETIGYVNPGIDRFTVDSFKDWVKGAGTLPSNRSAVLVDYIDARLTTGTPIDCNALTGSPGYLSSPPNAVTGTSFFACIRDTDTQSDDRQREGQFSRSNQDVYLFLRGDASVRSSSLSPASDASRSPTLQTQVLIRGIINKSPTN